MSARIFSEQDDLVLKELYSNKTNKELVEIFNGQFSTDQIKYRAKALELKKTDETKTRARVARGWELWEIEIIKRHYFHGGTKGCQKYLPHRSLNSIRYKAQRLKLKQSDEAKRQALANGPKIHTEETRQKISKIHKGIKWSEERRENNTAGFKSGKEHPSYIDGRNSKKQKYSSGWNRIREEIKARDKGCRICGKQNLLVVHHIDWNKKHSTPDNLITLCRKHHYKVHRDKEKYLQVLLDLVGTQEQST